MEQELNLPILGVIPWLDKEMYDEPDVMFTINEAASFYSLAYQKTVSCLNIKSRRANKSVFAFTSTGFTKFRSSIIMNLAYSLSRTGQSVMVVDADFRTPSVAKEIGIKTAYKGDLPELLSNYSEDEIDFYTYSIPGISNLFVMPNNGNHPDPSLYLHSNTFSRLIQILGIKYDWVFIDTPPAIGVPDSLAIGSYVDGVIMVTGLRNDKAILKKVIKEYKTYDIDIFGIIARKQQTKEAASANKYIKQMLSQMISQNEKLLTE